MKKFWSLLLICSFVLSGCFWPFAARKGQTELVRAGDGISVEVLDPALLSDGGRICFMLFSAGADAAAGEALDHVSLMMLKGFSDGLSPGGRFTLVSCNDANAADIVIRGHIDEFRTRGYFNKTVFITARGDARLSKNENIVAVIFARQKVAAVVAKVDQAVYGMGSSIARQLSE